MLNIQRSGFTPQKALKKNTQQQQKLNQTHQQKSSSNVAFKAGEKKLTERANIWRKSVQTWVKDTAWPKSKEWTGKAAKKTREVMHDTLNPRSEEAIKRTGNLNAAIEKQARREVRLGLVQEGTPLHSIRQEQLAKSDALLKEVNQSGKKQTEGLWGKLKNNFRRSNEVRLEEKLDAGTATDRDVKAAQGRIAKLEKRLPQPEVESTSARSHASQSGKAVESTSSKKESPLEKEIARRKEQLNRLTTQAKSNIDKKAEAEMARTKTKAEDRKRALSSSQK